MNAAADPHLEHRLHLTASAVDPLRGHLEVVAELAIDGSVAIVRERAREFAAGLARRLGLDVVVDVEDAAGRPVLSVATDSVCHAASAKKDHA